MFNLVNRARAKKNKGFSLVELIVVVLIIAIIAVALAPQVMKYVGKARSNTSDNTAATLKSAAQAAVAEYQGEANATTFGAVTYKAVSSGGISDSDTTGTPPAKLTEYVKANVGTDKIDNDYTIEISSSGALVKVTKVS